MWYLLHTIYDFHTHIDNIGELEEYLREKILPVVNIRSKDEYDKYMDMLDKLGSDGANTLYSVGIHPHDANMEAEKFSGEYETMVKQAPFMGEIGMDSVWTDLDKNIQKKSFTRSLQIAKKYKKTVILHTKGMEKEILETISKYDLTYIVHWYGCHDYQELYIDLGAYFTIGPAVHTDLDVQKLVKNVKLDHILVETDGVAAIEWLYGKKIKLDSLRKNLEGVYEKIAQIKGIDLDLVIDTIENTSRKLIKSASI